MTIGMESKEKKSTAADLNQEMSPDSNIDQNRDADVPEGFEECEKSIGTSLADILRQAVNGTDDADRTAERSNNCAPSCDSNRGKKHSGDMSRTF